MHAKFTKVSGYNITTPRPLKIWPALLVKTQFTILYRVLARREKIRQFNEIGGFS
jgi:hypothetical protein